MVDGKLDEPDWHRAGRMKLQKVLSSPQDRLPLRESTQVAALWDQQALYLAFEIDDKEVWATLTHHNERLFQEECVEVFIDPDGDGSRYIEAQINSLNTMRDLLVDGSVNEPTRAQFDRMAQWHFKSLNSAVNTRPGLGWTLEMAIPWNEFSFSGRSWPPTPGSVLRANFCRYERSESGEQPLELSAWSPVRSSFHEPERFGKLVFEEAQLY